MKICQNCKTEFIAQYPNQRYCSNECFIEARKKARIKREAKYKENQSIHNSSTNSLDETVRKIEEYNKKHGTRLSYGKWQVKKFFGEILD